MITNMTNAPAQT